jgi:iron(III) transport system substrate-binding protein
MRSRLRAIVVLLAVCVVADACASGEVNVVCSVALNWCEAAAFAFSRETGVAVKLTQKGSGDALAQLAFEAADPRHDVWYGGTEDAHVRAADLGLTAQYRSPLLPQLHPWAVRAAERSRYHLVALYAATIGFAYNRDALAKKHLPPPRCWSDLARADYAGDVQMPDPHASGAGYAALATLVQVFGEDSAFELMRGIDRNVRAYPRTEAGAMRAAARGETVVAVTFLRDAVTEVVNGFPIDLVAPCEGAGYDVGAMSIIDNGPNAQNARKFYDWALTPAAQRIGADTRNYVAPSNRATPTIPAAPAIADMRLAPEEVTMHSTPSERFRLLERWDREVHATLR